MMFFMNMYNKYIEVDGHLICHYITQSTLNFISISSLAYTQKVHVFLKRFILVLVQIPVLTQIFTVNVIYTFKFCLN